MRQLTFPDIFYYIIYFIVKKKLNISFFLIDFDQTGKSHIGSLSRHNGDPMKGFPLTPQYDSAVMYGGIQGAASIVPR